MAGIGALLSPLVSDVGSALTPANLLSQAAATAGVTVLMAGLNTSQGANAVDPFHLLIKPQSAPGTTLTSAAAAAMPAATIAALAAQPGGLHIV